MVTQNELERATKRARAFTTRAPKAVSARYDKRLGRVIVHLNTNLDIAFSPQDAEGLEHAKPSQLETIEITPSGFGIHFPKLDADLYLRKLRLGKGIFASHPSQTAQRMGHPEEEDSVGGKMEVLEACI